MNNLKRIKRLAYTHSLLTPMPSMECGKGKFFFYFYMRDGIHNDQYHM